MKVSVVVPIYNQEDYLHDALDSLVAQTMSDIEFIAINDGSTDRSLEIIQEYAKKDSRFVVVDKENGGVASATNLGNQMAKGEYLAEMDSDDYAAPDMYEKLYNTAVKHDLDIIKSNVINFTGSGETFKSVTEKIARPGYFDRVIDPMEEKIVFSFPMALLHKSADGQATPFPGHTYPKASVTGMPSAVKPFMTATRI